MEKENKINIYKTTIKTEDSLYEMVYDRIQNKTYFVRSNKSGDLEHFIEKVEVDGQTYWPLSPKHNLVDKKVILFPSFTYSYDNENEILEEIRAFIHKYLDISPVFEQIASYYVLFTWQYDRFNEVPYLRAIGDFGSGKSRFIQTIGILCYKPIFTAGATTSSPIFRILNEINGTLILDEADFRFSDMTSEIVKILNTGYQSGTPVLRCEGKGTFEVKAYEVFGPKIIATRETFTDKALESRFLVEEMGIGKLRIDVPRTLDNTFYTEAENIRNKLLMWRLKNYFQPIEHCKDIIEKIHPRLNQIVIPLLSVIKEPEAKEKLKEFIIKYNKELIAEKGLSWESDIVYSILKLEYETGMPEVTVGQITEIVNREADISDKNLEARKIGYILRSRLHLKTYRTRKGYILSFKENRAKLDSLKDGYGITDADIKGEQVNDVNVIQPAQAVPVQSLAF